MSGDPLPWETVISYLSGGGGAGRSVSLVGAEGKCINLDPLMVHVAFPGVTNFSDILSPESSFETIVEVARLLHTGR